MSADVSPLISEVFAQIGGVYDHHVLSCNRCRSIVFGSQDPGQDLSPVPIPDISGGCVWRVVSCECCPTKGELSARDHFLTDVCWDARSQISGFPVFCSECGLSWGFHVCSVKSAGNLLFVGSVFSPTWSSSLFAKGTHTIDNSSDYQLSFPASFSRRLTYQGDRGSIKSLIALCASFLDRDCYANFRAVSTRFRSALALRVVDASDDYFEKIECDDDSDDLEDDDKEDFLHNDSLSDSDFLF